jgi:hypothetical protein
MYLCNQIGSFYSAYVWVFFQLNCHPASFTPSSSHKFHVTRGLSLAYAVTVVTCVVLFSRILLFMMLHLDSIMESKSERKSGNKAKKSRKVLTLYERK